MRISVVLCTCNGQTFLPRQLRSLADQDRRPDELVVFDDASTDESDAIVRRFAQTAPFDVRVHIQPGRVGVMRNFAAAIGAASGEMIACCDQDDVWHPEKLARAEEALGTAQNGSPAADLVFSDAELVDEQLRPLGRRLWESIGFCASKRRIAEEGRLWEVLIRFNAVTGAGMAFRGSWRNLLLPIPNGWMYDAWIGLMLAIVGRCKLIDEPLWSYRRHATQQIGPGPDSLAAKIAAARRMDQSYFQVMAANFLAVVDRLGQRPIDLTIAARLRDKINHCQARAAMRGAGGERVGRIAGELFSGRYHQCALGWQSAAQDIFLAQAPLAKA
ncbi:MAG: glycosyltransferase [Tepidisphaeraceae bacterium]